MNDSALTCRPTSGYSLPAAEKEAAGIGVLNTAAKSRHAQAERLFYRLGAPSFGQTGGRSRKARRCRAGTPTSVRSALPIGVGKVVQNHARRNTMKSTYQGAPAPSLDTSVSPTQPTLPRRRLAPNVIALHAEDRPPVVQTRRRGRYPACVARFTVGRSRLYVGAVCALRTPLNDDTPVRVVEIHQNGDCVIEAVSPRPIICVDGEPSCRATTSNQSLVRTATLGLAPLRVKSDFKSDFPESLQSFGVRHD